MSNEISIDMLNQTSDNEISNNETSTIETHFGVNYHQGINTNENSRENSTSRRNVNPRLENTLPLCVTDPKNRIPRRYNIIKTSCMMKDDCPRHRTYLKLMLLRINSGNDIGKEEIFFYSYRKQGKSTNNSSSYGRLFMFLDLHDENASIYYMIQSTTQHTNMWNFNRSIRDNGDISIGTTVCVLNPRPVERLMYNQVPIIETDHPLVTLCTDANLPNLRMKVNMPANEMKGFLIKNVQLTFQTFACVQGKCSGYFCDRQRIKDLVQQKRGCGFILLDEILQLYLNLIYWQKLTKRQLKFQILQVTNFNNYL